MIELAIIAIEAGVLWILLRWRFLVREPRTLSLWTVLRYSFTANWLALVGSFVSMFLGI